MAHADAIRFDGLEVRWFLAGIMGRTSGQRLPGSPESLLAV